MINIIGKARPANLPVPCSTCEKYTETEKSLDDVTRALWSGTTLDFNRCRFQPLLAGPGDADQCPHSDLLGKTVIVVECDLCQAEFDFLRPNDPRLPNFLADQYNTNIKHVCPECIRSGRTTPLRKITILGGDAAAKREFEAAQKAGVDPKLKIMTPADMNRIKQETK